MRLTGLLLAAALAVLAFVPLAAGSTREAAAAPIPPACASDLRHVSWTWQFTVDGAPVTVAQKLVANNMGVLVKTHDGTDWMSRFDKHPDAVSGPAKVRSLADLFESRGVPFTAWAVVHGEDPITEAHMASQVLHSGARAIVLDLEPFAGFWRGTPQSALVFGQELRRLAPDAVIIVAVDPRPWHLPKVPLAEFASFSDAFAPMVYWESFKSNGQFYTNAGYPPGPAGVTPEFILDVGNSILDRYNLPILPIGQGNSADIGAWTRFIDHSAVRGMPVLSTWRHGVTHAPVFDLLRQKSPGGWPGACGAAPAGTLLGGDFTGDGRTDLLHLTRRDYTRPWLASSSGGFNVGFFRPWAGYGVQAGKWLMADFTGDGKDDALHLTDGGYANVWRGTSSGAFSLVAFQPWPGYGMRTGSFHTGDFNGDGKQDVLHLTDRDYAHLWLGQANGSFAVTAFQPWPGYGLHSGSFQVGDFNGDGRHDLMHLTEHDYAHIWLGQASGSFSVLAFKPWPGYGMRSGTFRVGDFNGDGRHDLMHLTDQDYAHVWFGLPDAGFNVTAFRPWPGYGMSATAFQIGDFNGDGRSDLLHLTTSDYAHVWQGLPNGSFAVTAYKPWPGYGMRFGSTQVADFNGDGRSDLLHMTDEDYVHVWQGLANGSFAVTAFRPWAGYRF